MICAVHVSGKYLLFCNLLFPVLCNSSGAISPVALYPSRLKMVLFLKMARVRLLLRDTVISPEMSMWPKQKTQGPFYTWAGMSRKRTVFSLFLRPIAIFVAPWRESTQESRTRRWKRKVLMMPFKPLDSAMPFAPHHGSRISINWGRWRLLLKLT